MPVRSVTRGTAHDRLIHPHGKLIAHAFGQTCSSIGRQYTKLHRYKVMQYISNSTQGLGHRASAGIDDAPIVIPHRKLARFQLW